MVLVILVTNTLAYYTQSLATTVKSLSVSAPSPVAVINYGCNFGFMPFVRKPFGRITVGQMTCGLKTFYRQTFDRLTFGQKTRGLKTFEDRSLINTALVNFSQFFDVVSVG